MLGRLYPSQECSAARALELVGERWTLLILRDALFKDFTRFSQFQQSLSIAPNILTKRLNDLVDNGILRTHTAADRSDHHEYLLTEMGQTLKPVITSLTVWGDRWVRPGPAVFVHETCGTEVSQRYDCPHCGDTVAPEAVRANPRLTAD
ncbi:winged helix-turn-helix transcriptional regulator [Stackebrandtia nassauensis]|uniref:Transcriptional regulator, HxlR family n=1 Tax=Stackebrandtia nassauensis (strain DSM 44728 / CIP 108903 / NRRL B-16338 / NBRC 102104 / LLR-40K-21) TaxID=446470 RepID=D3Q4P2_STANL|nr:helix-turn-helix domain-containing protein [Stackebrandtia nassauensis]ADD42072.1 transcriptional regulator, HxlR family [Stackebrandtia nassauensis DSM 44728]